MWLQPYMALRYVHGVMVQVMIQLVQHYSVVVLFDRFSLGTDAVILFQEIAAKAAEPGHVVSIEAMHILSNTTYIFMSPSSYSE